MEEAKYRLPINHPRDGYSGHSYPAEVIYEIYRLKDRGYNAVEISGAMDLSYRAVLRYIKDRKVILLKLNKRKNELTEVRERFGKK